MVISASSSLVYFRIVECLTAVNYFIKISFCFTSFNTLIKLYFSMQFKLLASVTCNTENGIISFLCWFINPIQYGPFWDCSSTGRSQKAPLPKICHTYPTMTKVDTVIPCLKKNQKPYKSRDTLLELCWHRQFFAGNHQLLLYQEIQI